MKAEGHDHENDDVQQQEESISDIAGGVTGAVGAITFWIRKFVLKLVLEGVVPEVVQRASVRQ